MSIAYNIKLLRTSHKLSQSEFGEIAGVSDKAVSSWETGEKIPRMGAIQKIADHFGITKSDIIEDYPLVLPHSTEEDSPVSRFGKRFRELRDSHNLTQQELADALNISKSSVNMYERGEREPDFEQLEAMASYFNVDLDYLTGRVSDLKAEEPNEKESVSQINKNLLARRKELGLTQAEVAEIVGVSDATISRWETGDISNMRRDKIVLYAKALQISPFDIVGVNDLSITEDADYSEIYRIKGGRRLKNLRKQKGFTQLALANLVGLATKTSIAHYENGRGIPPVVAEKLAEILNTTPAYLMGWEDDDTPNAEKNFANANINPAPAEITSNISTVNGGQNIYSIPVFGTVSAGFGAYAEDEIIDYIPVVINNPADVEDTISIKVAGDSMYPMISDDDIIIVRRQTSVDSGDIAVVLVDNTEGLVKRVVYGSTWIELQSINEQYPTQRFDGAEVTRLRVVGKVLGSYRQF